MVIGVGVGGSGSVGVGVGISIAVVAVVAAAAAAAVAVVAAAATSTCRCRIQILSFGFCQIVNINFSTIFWQCFANDKLRIRSKITVCSFAVQTNDKRARFDSCNGGKL